MRTLQVLLITAAVFCAFCTMWIGFGHWHAQDSHVLGWLGAALTAYLVADLIDLVDR